MIPWTEQEQKGWDDWVSGRPECIQKMCASHPPNTLYKIKATGHIVFIMSYFENNTIKVQVSNEYNPNIAFERDVFGLSLKDLEPYTET